MIQRHYVTLHEGSKRYLSMNPVGLRYGDGSSAIEELKVRDLCVLLQLGHELALAFKNLDHLMSPGTSWPLPEAWEHRRRSPTPPACAAGRRTTRGLGALRRPG